MVRVAFQGEPGAYSEGAVRQLVGPHVKPGLLRPMGLPAFEDVFVAVEKGSTKYGVVPIENTLGGSIHTNYDLLVMHPKIYILGECDFRVVHCLLAHKGKKKSDIKRVLSHPQALAQTDNYLRANGLTPEASYDTAGSAKMIAEKGLVDCAAVCSELCSETYGLEILAKGIQDFDFNHTRFLLLGTKPCVLGPEMAGRVKTSIVFWLSHEAGSLFKAVGVFAMRDINLTKIESRPVPAGFLKQLLAAESGNNDLSSGLPLSRTDSLASIPETEESPTPKMKKRESFSSSPVPATPGGQNGPGSNMQVPSYYYLFYVDIVEDQNTPRMHNAINHLKEIAKFVRVLGSYPVNAELTEDVTSELSKNDVDDLPIATPSSSPQKVQMLRIGIIGSGELEQFLAEEFAKKHTVFMTMTSEANYVANGVTLVHWENIETMLVDHHVDVLLISTSIESFERTLRSLPQNALAKSQPLIVDILPVKVLPKKLMMEVLPDSCDILCSHPMFGGSSGSKGRENSLQLVFDVVRARRWERANRFLSIFQEMQCEMIGMSCEDHDAQVLPQDFIAHVLGSILENTTVNPAHKLDTVKSSSALCLQQLIQFKSKDQGDFLYSFYKSAPTAASQMAKLLNALEEMKITLEQRALKDGTASSASTKLHLGSLVNTIEESATAKVFGRAKKLQEEGHKINRALCVGEPDYAPPPAVFQALKEVDASLSRYTVVQGAVELRQAICKDLNERKGVSYEPDQICVSNGGKQALYQVLLAVCEAGDEVLVPTPCWVSYHDIARLCRAKPLPVETQASDGFLLRPKPLLEALQKSPRCRVLVLCNPSNPTGALMTKAELDEIAAVLRKPEFAHVYILADEIYERITFDTHHVCFAALPGMYERTLLINGFSKGHAMTGYRLGYLAASKTIVSACIKLQGQITSCASSVAQHAALAALKVPQSWVDERVKELREKRDFVLRKLKEIPGVYCEVPKGAFYAFPDLSGCLTDSASVCTGVDFCNVLLDKHKVALVPGEAFHSKKSVRISYAATMEDLESAMSAFAACIKELAPQDNRV